MGNALVIKDFKVAREGNDIVSGVSLTIPAGEVHALMGPNGSGKSSFANGLMGHPAYDAEGTVIMDGDDIMEMKPDEKARKAPGSFSTPC